MTAKKGKKNKKTAADVRLGGGGGGWGKWVPQLVHIVLLRQVFHKNFEEIWVDFCGKIMPFGIGEFSFLTGLKCVGSAHKLLYEDSDDGLFNKYFASIGRFNLETIRIKFLSRSWSNDNDAAKLAIHHFLANYKMDNEPYISTTTTLVYNKCQWWFYEICNHAPGLIYIKVDNLNSTIPRMLKSKADNSVDKEFLVRKFYTLRSDQLSNVVPTEEEIERWKNSIDHFEMVHIEI
ncbi:hypothetical protein STAS_34339 [Striga asiatica]|uniref:DUF1985 domain-containing protein n=1 Tax=Striga asiatica TaxID=4170 RepID=A0A5A7RHF9_STRAF|nr:hypothetical protein STAS_34339 [Striga asiatica]